MKKLLVKLKYDAILLLEDDKIIDVNRRGIQLFGFAKNATAFGSGFDSILVLHIAPRTASSSGTGTESATGNHVSPRNATADGNGTTSGNAIGLHVSPRTANASASGIEVGRISSPMTTVPGSRSCCRKRANATPVANVKSAVISTSTNPRMSYALNIEMRCFSL